MDIFVLKVSFIKYTFAITIWSPKQTNVFIASPALLQQSDMGSRRPEINRSLASMMIQ